MLYLFYGDDSKSKLAAYEKFLQPLSKKHEVFSIEKNNFSSSLLENFYSGDTLFSPLSVLVFRNILEHPEIADLVLEKLSLLGESKNIFIFLDGKLNKSVTDSFKKARTEINNFELPREKVEKFNSFSLANAFGSKDKLNLWIYFRQAISKGVAMEELAGILFWKIKDMIERKDFRKFSEAELKDFLSRLSFLLPEARREGKDAEAAFEKFLLDIF